MQIAFKMVQSILLTFPYYRCHNFLISITYYIYPLLYIPFNLIIVWQVVIICVTLLLTIDSVYLGRIVYYS